MVDTCRRRRRRWRSHNENLFVRTGLASRMWKGTQKKETETQENENDRKELKREVKKSEDQEKKRRRREEGTTR